MTAIILGTRQSFLARFSEVLVIFRIAIMVRKNQNILPLNDWIVDKRLISTGALCNVCKPQKTNACLARCFFLEGEEGCSGVVTVKRQWFEYPWRDPSISPCC